MILPPIIYLLTLIISSSSFEHLDYITRTYFANESLLFIYWTNVSSQQRDQLLHHWLKSEIGTLEICNCDLNNDNSAFGNRGYVQSTIVLFGSQNPDKNLLRIISKCRSWNSRSRILILIDGNDLRVTEFILQEIWSLTKAINVTVMTSSMRFYTSYPYRFSRVQEITSRDLFPRKIAKDFNGSVIKVATTVQEPFVFAPETNGYKNGLEIRIIRLLAEYHNFNVEYVHPPNGENPWILEINGKMIGNFGLLHRREVDLVFHGLQIRWDRCAHGDVTIVHTLDYLVWVVPKKSFSLEWMSLLIIFPTELWALIVFFLIATTITVYILTNYEIGSPKIFRYTFSTAFFQVIPLHLSTTAKFYRKGHVYRFFMITFSFYVLVITSLYQSSLITYLTTEHAGEQYEDITEAVDDGLIAHLFVGGKTVYNVNDFALWAKILSPAKHVYAGNYTKILEIIAINKTGYSLLMKAGSDFEVNKHFLDKKNKPMVHVLRENYLPYLVSMFTPIGHPLTDFFKTGLLRLVENGLINHWIEDLNLKNRKVGLARNDHEPLSVAHLRGVFYIIPLFSIVATVVFVGEVIHKEFKKRRNEKRMKGIDQNLLEFSATEKWKEELKALYNHRATSFIQMQVYE